MLKKKLRIYKTIFDKIEKSKKILIISPKKPDLDSIGSALGLYKAIKDNYYGKEIILSCVNNIPTNFNIFSDVNKYRSIVYPRDYDLIFFVNCSSIKLTGFEDDFPDLFDKNRYNTISIDNNILGDKFANQTILNTTYYTTSMLIFEMLYFGDKKINQLTATYLLTGLYKKPKNFERSKINKSVYYVTYMLLKLGANYKEIRNNIFKKNNLGTIKLFGKLINNSFIDNNGVFNCYINNTLLKEYNADFFQIFSLMDYINNIDNVIYPNIFIKKGDYVKASLNNLKGNIKLNYGDKECKKLKNYGGAQQNNSKNKKYDLKTVLEPFKKQY